MRRIVLAAAIAIAAGPCLRAADAEAQTAPPASQAAPRADAQVHTQREAPEQAPAEAPPASHASKAAKDQSSSAGAPADEPGDTASKQAGAGKGAQAAPAIALAAKALAVKPGHYKLDPDHGKITWSVNHLGFSTYSGEFGTVSADLTLDPRDVGQTALTASVDMASVGTLNPKLDAILKSDEWFDVKVYPQATFKATKVTVTGPQTARIDGDLTLRGKTAPIVISATFNNAGVDQVDKTYTVGFDGASIIRRSSFGVTRYVPFVGDNVTLHLEGEFKLQQ